MASALRLRVRSSVAIKAAVNLRPARVSAAFRARAAIAAVPIAIAVVCLREAAAAVPVVDAADHVLLKNNGLDPRIVYAGIGAVVLLLIVLIVVLLRGCASSAPENTPRDAHCYQDDDQEVF